MEEMNSLERTLKTIAFEPVDRVPVDLHNFMVTPRFMNVTDFAEFYRDGEAMAEGQIRAWKEYGHDVLLLENGTAALAEACGVGVFYQEDSAPAALEPAISSLDEVDSLEVPDPYKDPLLSELLKATRIVVEEIGQEAFIIGRADQGPFSLASEIRGMDHFFLDLAERTQLDKVHQLLEFCLKVTERFALAQMEQGAHATSIGDSPSGPDMISPAHYMEFAHPYVERLVGSLKKKDVMLAYHICGNATPILEEMVGTGATILEIDQKADQKQAKAAAQGKATLLGPIDPSWVMVHSSPEVVMEKCQEAITNLSPGGGFILGPGCALPATTPDENIHALVESAKRFKPLPAASI